MPQDGEQSSQSANEVAFFIELDNLGALSDSVEAASMEVDVCTV